MLAGTYLLTHANAYSRYCKYLYTGISAVVYTVYTVHIYIYTYLPTGGGRGDCYGAM